MSALQQQYGNAAIRETDILVGRGKRYSDHIGTIAFKALIEANVSTYMDEATESCDKTYLIVEIIESIFKQGGRFLKETTKCSGIWIETSRKEAHSKVRHSFRDAAIARQKKKRSLCDGGDDVLAKAKNFSVRFDSSSSFKDIVSKIRQDLAVKQILKASKEVKQFKKAAKKAAKSSRRRKRDLVSKTPSSAEKDKDTMPTLIPSDEDAEPSSRPTRVFMVSPALDHDAPICTSNYNGPTTALRSDAVNNASDNRTSNSLLQTLQKVISIAETLHTEPRHDRLTDEELLRELDDFVCDDFADPTEELLDCNGDEIDDYMLVCAV